MSNTKILKSAVSIKRKKNKDICIVKCSREFEPLMNGIHPDDNFDNTEYIPIKPGKYTFDVSIAGGEDFNGENTEYWSEFLLLNCK